MNLNERLNERLKYAAMKARHKNILLPWYKRWWGVIILAVAALFLILLIAASLYVISRTKEILNGQNVELTEQQQQEYFQMINGDSDNYALGSLSPQATIIEFGDFACPYSKESAPIIKRLTEEHRDKLKIVWRDYLRNSDSIDLALAGRCAGEQGKFWPMHDLLFDNQDNLTTADAQRPGKLVALAAALQLDTTKFTSCLTERKYLPQIQKDYQDGNSLEIVGTPSWFVGGYAFHGALSEQKFRELIGGIIK